MENYYTVAELSELLNVPKNTIYYWRTTNKDGFPDAVRIGKYLRWEKSVIDQWINESLKPTNLADNLADIFTAMTDLSLAIANDTDIQEPLRQVKVAVDAAL